MEEALKQVALRMVAGKNTVALTGAGISVESGIPDFRSKGGLWERFAPMEYATIEAFRRDPAKVWRMLREMDELVGRAEPNPAHLGLARLEELGMVAGVITQNIDSLHQAAGSRKVVEFHGNARRLVCLDCQAYVDAALARARWEQEFPPRCPGCRQVLKPDVVFFGEPIPAEASRQAMHLAQLADVFLVVGTSAVVAPASYLPLVARKKGALVVEVNLERTVLSYEFADYTLLGKATLVLAALVSEVERLLDT